MNHNNQLNKLVVPPSQRDHYQGILNAPIILVEYGNYQCFQCKEVHLLIQLIQQHFNSASPENDNLCVVFRHFIERSIHPQAQKAAEAVEAAAAQGQFWQMHDILFEHQQELGNGYLVEYADYLGLNISHFLQDIFKRVHVNRIHEDIEGGKQSGVTVAPALFINGIRYLDRWSVEELMVAIVAANNESV